MILIAEVIGFVLYTGIVWYFGRNWDTLNSSSDLETAYKTAAAKVDSVKADIATEIATAETKTAALKALV